MGGLIQALFEAPKSTLICNNLEDRTVEDAMDDLLQTMEEHGGALELMFSVNAPTETLREVVARIAAAD